MKQLRAVLDEMLSPVLAERLVEAGHDVVAVKSIPELISRSDHDLLVEATAQERSLVTRNIKDFQRIAKDWKGAQRPHAGLIYLTPAIFPADTSLIGAVIHSLTAAATSGQLPEPDGALFLRRVS